MERKLNPHSQKDKSFSLGTFGTHATGFKCFYNNPRFRRRFLNQGLNDSIKKEQNELS
ncbi:hypothetical protein KVE17_05400 [Helicobacter pylori]|uniref:hypothetical protein n=1 Tax=Helicobacter pylori TaxID=210 RepID=UPI0018E2F010|nr:hypothetical protein [Helicobacter pylori]WRE47048.1 hypothetical protein KVE17_05400 [Helicobacter pylori]